MAASGTQAGSRRSRLAVAAAFACLAAGLIAIGATTPADAVKPREIGKTEHAPDPSCPTPDGSNPPARKACKVFGKVTGFQKIGDGKKGLMRIPADGHIVGWAVDLSRPDKEERKFFEDKLDGAAAARIAMLTQADKNKYRLRAQTPYVSLKGLYGQRQYFTLRNPLEVKEGWITGLTSKSWIPNLAHDLEGGRDQNLWKASRTRNRCTKQGDLINRSRPHKNVGSTRAYGCTYSDRLLYWAYFVPS